MFDHPLSTTSISTSLFRPLFYCSLQNPFFSFHLMVRSLDFLVKSNVREPPSSITKSWEKFTVQSARMTPYIYYVLLRTLIFSDNTEICGKFNCRFIKRYTAYVYRTQYYLLFVRKIYNNNHDFCKRCVSFTKFKTFLITTQPALVRIYIHIRRHSFICSVLFSKKPVPVFHQTLGCKTIRAASINKIECKITSVSLYEWLICSMF